MQTISSEVRPLFRKKAIERCMTTTGRGNVVKKHKSVIRPVLTDAIKTTSSPKENRNGRGDLREECYGKY